jgi:hypothetical protein
VIKVTVRTQLFAKWYVNINSSHFMIMNFLKL